MDNLNLSVNKREVTGKKVSDLRSNGLTPIHMYGPEIESSPLQCDSKILDRVITDAGTNIPVTVNVDGGEQDNLCFIREVQYHPVTNKVLHVDFMKVQVGKPVRAQVPISVIGTSPAVRTMGGTLLQPLLTLTVEALPLEIPEAIILQAELLVDFETNFYVSDIEVDEEVNVINEASEMVASVVAPRVDRIESEGEEGEETETEVVGEEAEESTGDDSSG
ncbi:MAG: 50S ribosomal protein L25 [SAR202 cluster bacterium]|nr:50S ribosomal protein L25 [SAR202 cluster bacterium]HJO60133.1 50S ribosomal protein L25 [SAR202 cluster bacterium]